MTLTGQEERVLRLKAQGHTSKAVADLLGVSVQTIKNHQTNAYRKLGADNLAGAIYKRGWVVIPGEPFIDRERCTFVAQCGLVAGHSGHHADFWQP